jgi:AcrR family transcriptional regulator
MDETRARILDAAVELYETAGPANTTMSAVARTAGVTRATLYRHFPRETDVANAVLDEWQRSVVSVGDLRGLYAAYRSSEAMIANLLRDEESLPAGRGADVRAPAARVRATLGDGADSAAAVAATALAVSFEAWRSLARQGLGDATIADLMTRFIAAAGNVRGTAGRTARGRRDGETGRADAASRAKPSGAMTASALEASGTSAPVGPAEANASAPKASAPKASAPTRQSAPKASAPKASAPTRQSAPKASATKASAPKASAPSSPTAAAAPAAGPVAQGTKAKGKGKGGKKAKGDRKGKARGA